MMKKSSRALAGAALTIAVSAGIAVAGATPALAANKGGSCKLSANWKVNFSATYNDNGGGNATTRYFVETNPGNLNTWYTTIYNANGSTVWGPYAVGFPASPSRVNTTISGYHLFVINQVWGGPNNTTCQARINLY
jgi:hypothetical protein